MLISCNKLKTHIKNGNEIDWLKIWDTFTIRSAEVESITIKGNDIKDVVTAEIIKCEPHPTKEKYHLLEVSDGTKTYHILCGAPNVRVGLKTPMVKVGGMVSGITIEPKTIAGFLSEGMCCAGDELGINDNHEGILELPSDTPLGVDIKTVYPLEDVIVEIDNKSLTNRPDMWGHYGIAREIAAITNNELLPLPIYEIENDKKDLDIKINSELCLRYCGIKMSNILNHETPVDMQIFLKYTGMRSISLIVDLTNYLMLELGQPMHAFDAREVKNIVVDTAKDNEEFTTLDGQSRKLNNEVLMIKNDSKNFGIAGIMGGLNSEILPDTTSIVLESASFDATNIRKSATYLGLRTEASSRYEKSLDPNIAIIASKRFVYLLKELNKDLIFETNLTDIYPKELKETHVTLKKEKLHRYMGIQLQDNEVKNILERLSFKIQINDDNYIITVPTYRATKDITIDADIIEEISRMYGYENIKSEPLKLDLTFKVHENVYEEEYIIKKFLCDRYSASEVHSYLWYDTNFLKQCNVNIHNITVINKSDNNILRDNLSFSLLPIVRKNYKFFDNFIIYEIGTVIKNNENKRSLAIVLAANDESVETNYNKAKMLVKELFKAMKNKNVSFDEYVTEEYNTVGYGKNIIVDNNILGTLNIINSAITYNVGKKKSIVTIEIDFDEYIKLESNKITSIALNKYQATYLDFTIITPKNSKYSDIEAILNEYNNELIVNYKLIDLYEDENNKKYSIRFFIESKDNNISSEELNKIKTEFISLVEKHNYNISE